MRLNGWQRLWVVASVLSLLMTVAIVVSGLRDVDQIEEVAFHTQRLAKEIAVADIAGIGTVNFPNDLTKEDISVTLSAACLRHRQVLLQSQKSFSSFVQSVRLRWQARGIGLPAQRTSVRGL